MRICQVKEKKVAIYDSLILFERVIISRAFPKMRWMLDASLSFTDLYERLDGKPRRQIKIAILHKLTL
jgi:hypothetical protein